MVEIAHVGYVMKKMRSSYMACLIWCHIFSNILSLSRLIWSLNRFLAAAAKKYYPARIVIVIDGVFAIKVR